MTKYRAWLVCALMTACSASKNESGSATSNASSAGGSGDAQGGSGGTGASLTVGSGGRQEPPLGEGELVWSKGYGGPDLEGVAIALDADANVFATGFYYGEGALGGPALASAFPSDVMIAKLDRNGSHLWSTRAGGPGQDKARAVAVDSTGAAVVVGYFEGAAVIGDTSLDSAGGRDAFVAKYDATGTAKWGVRIGGNGHDAAYGVAIDSHDDIVVCGYFSSTASFGSNQSLASDGGFDAFVVKLDASGTPVGAAQLGGSGSDVAFGVAVGANDDIAVVGSCGSGCDLGAGEIAGPGSDVFVVKTDSVGSYQWGIRHGGGARDVGNAVAFNSMGGVVVGGYFMTAADLGGGDVQSAGDRDAFVAQYAGADGAHEWSRTFGGTGRDEVRAVAVDGKDMVAASGYLMGEVDLGNGLTDAHGSLDTFVAKIPPSGGAPLWDKRLGGKAWDEGTSVAIDLATNAIVAAGSFSAVADFGLGAITASGDEDIYVLRISAGQDPVPE